jgi:hypothetical protein
VNLGSVIPFFFRHSRSAANRFAPPAGALPVGVVDFGAAPALVPVEEVELVEEPPHAASRRLVSTTRRTAAKAGWGLRLLVNM